MQGSDSGGMHKNKAKGCGNMENLQNDIAIISGEAAVKTLERATFQCPGARGRDGSLEFEKAYKLERVDTGNGIYNCVYRICGREFKDLSFAEGATLQKYPGRCEVRVHDDGTKFLFFYESIPTFDFSDRIWSGVAHTVAYCEDGKIILLHCAHGARISSIEVYLGLTKSVPAFDERLEALR